MFEFLQSPTGQLVTSMLLLIWSSVWTLLAMWKAGNKKHQIWFVLIFLSLLGWYLYPNIFTTILGLFGALPIFYFFLFSRFSFVENKLVFEKWGKSKKKAKK